MNALAQVKESLNHSATVWGSSYVLWYSVFVFLSICAIILPLFIASGLGSDSLKRILGVVTASCIGILQWGNIGVAANNFDRARNMAEDALGDYPNDPQKLAAALKAARAILVGNGPSVIPKVGTEANEHNS